jgi:hypothetical protein
MKRQIKKLLGLTAIALAALGGLTTVASAAPIQTVTSGGVTCGQYNRGTGFPATYWDCITPNTNTSNAVTAANAANGLPSNVKTVLTNVNAQIYLFNSPTDYANFSGGSPIGGAFGAIHTGSPNDSTANMAAIFKTATVAGTPNTDLSNYYAGNILQQLGRTYGNNAPANANGDSLKPTDIFFESAINDDRTYLGNTTGVDKPDYPSSATVWGATVAAAYPGKSPWEIFGLRYGSSESFIYGFAVGRQGSTPTVPELNTFLQSYMSTTRLWVTQQVFLVNPQNYQIGNSAGTPYPYPDAVLCVETNGLNVFPLTWWSCVRPYSPTPAAQDVKVYSNTLPVAWQTLLKNAGVKVYAMRNIVSFIDFDGRSPGAYTGVLGFSVHSNPIRSAAFQENFLDETHTGFLDQPQYFSGTILHELGHQFDAVIWNNISYANSVGVLGSVRWQTAIAADKAAFNIGTCASKVDQDRINNGLAPVCANYPGQSNWDVLTQKLYGYKDSDPNPVHVQAIYVELWARAFADRAGGVKPQYQIDVQSRMTNQHSYMNDLWTTGAPHN